MPATPQMLIGEYLLVNLSPKRLFLDFFFIKLVGADENVPLRSSFRLPGTRNIPGLADNNRSIPVGFSRTSQLLSRGMRSGPPHPRYMLRS